MVVALVDTMVVVATCICIRMCVCVYLSLFPNISLNGFGKGCVNLSRCVNLSCSLIRLIGSPFPMVSVLGPEFRIPTQNFKNVKVTSVGLFGVVCESGSYLGSPGTCHVSQLLGSLLYLDSQPSQLRRLALDLDSLYNLARI